MSHFYNWSYFFLVLYVEHFSFYQALFVKFYLEYFESGMSFWEYNLDNFQNDNTVESNYIQMIRLCLRNHLTDTTPNFVLVNKMAEDEIKIKDIIKVYLPLWHFANYAQSCNKKPSIITFPIETENLKRIEYFKCKSLNYYIGIACNEKFKL